MPKRPEQKIKIEFGPVKILFYFILFFEILNQISDILVHRGNSSFFHYHRVCFGVSVLADFFPRVLRLLQNIVHYVLLQ